MIDPRVLSVNASPGHADPRGRVAETGIWKSPIACAELVDPGPKRVVDGRGVSGVVGDVVGDGRHHGGATQAVYAFAVEELQWWAAELGRELPAGSFGENLTTAGIDVDASVVGQRWQLGGDDGPVLRVTAPRIPCNTFRIRMGLPGWVKRFAERGRTGTYLAVEQPGTVRPGDAIQVLSTPDHSVTVPMLFRALTTDPRWAEQVLLARDDLEEEAVALLEKRGTFAMDAEPQPR